ncbi:hypothetical protein VRK_37000 [Vibrio sp. MEBiC08052]|nr:hypothetical protein VRK_37000 [Vibrio sp. MEBiC08052]
MFLNRLTEFFPPAYPVYFQDLFPVISHTQDVNYLSYSSPKDLNKPSYISET